MLRPNKISPKKPCPFCGAFLENGALQHSLVPSAKQLLVEFPWHCGRRADCSVGYALRRKRQKARQLSGLQSHFIRKDGFYERQAHLLCTVYPW